MSDYESATDEEDSSMVNKAIEKCLKMKPDLVISEKSKHKSLQDLRTKLQKSSKVNVKCGNNQRASNRINDRKKIEDCFHELTNDFAGLFDKFNTVIECVSEMIDRMEEIEDRVLLLEKNSSKTVITNVLPAPTFAEITKCETDNRIEKLEFASSDQERVRRLLQVTLTHPKLDTKTQDLNQHVRNFMVTDLKMEQRTIDLNMSVRNISRDNTVLITFSDRRFKLFFYSAKKRLRSEGHESANNLYMNDNLTSYNLSLLMKLKREKNKLSSVGKTVFELLYSYEGKIYVKINKNDPSSSAIHIKKNSCIDSLLRGNDVLRTLENDGAIASTSSNLENGQ